ncbi:MAG TPA: DUF4870 domain-containing protein [Rhodanobacteraceae bacterium]|nr:DUF4870 domain-containing protein [Rhodanobacteraceae bacterium]
MSENETPVPPAAASTTTPETPLAGSGDERMWATFAHLSALLGFVIPFGSVLGPLVVWLIKKDQMPLVDDQGKEALNFQITMVIAFIVCCILIFVLIGFLLMFVVALFDLIMVIIAAVRANNGEHYRYPLSIRFIK